MDGFTTQPVLAVQETECPAPNPVGHFGKQNSVLMVVGIEARVFASAPRSLITILTELHRLQNFTRKLQIWALLVHEGINESKSSLLSVCVCVCVFMYVCMYVCCMSTVHGAGSEISIA